MKPAKRHPLDPQPVIEYARQWARRDGVSRYIVVADGYAFEAVGEQPPANVSHWAVQPDGECWAHVDTNPDGRYLYAQADR